MLRLAALDPDDLTVLSALVQDAVVKVGEIDVNGRAGTVGLAMNRYVWEDETQARRGLARFFRRAPAGARRRSVLHFARVLSVQAHGIDRGATDAVLALLAIRHATVDGKAPEADIELIFAGDAALRLHVECIEAQLTDAGAEWSAARRPDHDGDE